MADKPTDMLGMSDEDFANLNGPPEADTSGQAPAAADDSDDDAGTTDDEEDNAPDDNQGDEGSESDQNAGDDEDDSSNDADDEGDTPPAPKEGESKPDPVGSEKKPKEALKPIDRDKPDETALASFYNQIMTPFKANGKTIELKTPQEAISLMQMGANYTRKMQDIQPHRKVLLMLQNNDLLDEDKLSFLIDLEKRNPEAIKKLVKESGIDPLDIDPAEEVAYRPGDHSVTDEEANFRSTMEELVNSNPNGRETVSEIYDNWDNTSKEALWNQPEMLTIIHEQRSTGVYDLIKTEVDRRKTLGIIPPNTPFMQAYTMVGDEMVAEATGKSAPKGQVTPQNRPVLAKRAAAPKSDVRNGDKASAASPTRSSPKQAKDVVNPLALSDDEFLKQMEGRL